MKLPRHAALLTLLFLCACASGPGARGAEPLVLDDDGSWCWFQEERAILHEGKLLVGSVSSGHRDAARRGDVNLLVHDVDSGTTRVVELHDRLQLDDHNAPALEVLSDGRVIAVYAGHGIDDLVRMRSSVDGDGFEEWGPERAHEQVMQQGNGVTYSNVFRLEAEGGLRGRLYDFYRGEGWDPNAITSEDDGVSWSRPKRLLAGAGRPYVRYASNGRDRIDFICTDQHPRSADNSVYHGFLRGGRIHKSTGLEFGLLGRVPVQPHSLTVVFAGDPDNVAWVSDLVLDAEDHPHAVFSVQKDGRGLPRGEGGLDCRYHYARFDGVRWHQHELAHAGRRLYPGEDDYTGLVVIDPADPARVFFSTDADPVTGAPLVSAADGERHYELFEGRTADGGATWTFRAITRDSVADNLRPIVPEPEGDLAYLLWMRGSYRTYQDFTQEVLALRL